jgi:polysaccharide biosynthesis/export protein
MRKMSSVLALLVFGASVAPGREATGPPGDNSAVVPASPGATSNNKKSIDPLDPVLAHREGRYQLCASDVIEVTFPLTPEFNQTLTIGPDGFASLAGAGEVYLQNLTIEETGGAIRKAYAAVLQDPIVAVELKDFNKPYFIATGKVNHPGKYDLRGETSAAQAIAIAGGFTDEARHSQVLLFRRVNDDWYEVRPLNLKAILQGRNVNEDPAIRPGDMLVVPQNTISKIKKFIPSSGLGAYYQP